MATLSLSTKELSNILNLLSEENLAASNLEALGANFHHTFSRQDHFRVGSALTMLLQDHDLLPLSSQRVAAIFLIFELYRSDPISANPFAAFFAELVHPSVGDDQGHRCGYRLSVVEKHFLSQLTTSSVPRELFKRTPASIASIDPSSLQPPDVPTLLASLIDPKDRSPAHTRVGKSCVLADPDPYIMSQPDPSAAGQAAETLLCGGEMLVEQPFEPGFIRPLPPLHSCDEEVTWLNPTESRYSVQWDNQMCTTGSADAKRLFAKACQEALTVQEQQALSAQFEADAKLVYHVGITPHRLPQLVEKNPTVAVDALLKLATSTQISAYFAALLNMEMSLHSMEVVNRLTSAPPHSLAFLCEAVQEATVELPSEFLHLYISNCIQRCREISDKSLQSRLVRLVCVFLQSLIRNKIINVQDEFLEIQAFCLDHSKIREAATLYRLLKSLENGEPAK